MESGIARRFEAAIGASFHSLGEITRLHLHLRAEAVAVCLTAHQFDPQPMIVGFTLVAKQDSRAVEHGHYQTLTPIIPEIRARCAAADVAATHRSTRFRSDLFELAIFEIVK